MAKLVYRDDDLHVDVPEGNISILDVSLLHKVPHLWECGGRGKCTTCRVQVLEGSANLSPRTRREQMLARRRGWDETTRLACQARLQGDVVLRRLVRNGADVTRIHAEELRMEPGREVPMAVMFCDLRDFTGIAQRFLPYDVVHILNRYYERIGEAVVYNNGYIFQYVGDELVAWFGLGGGKPETNCLNAVRSAVGILGLIGQVNRGLEEDFGLALGVSMGIHFGPTIIGNIGHASHKQLSAVGDTVNTAKRIESLNREWGTTLLISSEVERRVTVPLTAGRRGPAHLKGLEAPVELAAVTGFAEPEPLLLVQSTLERILGDPKAFGDRFYGRIFALAPGVRSLFKSDMQAQARMFADMLRMMLHGLARFEDIAPGLREEGRRHAAFGVRPEHYPVITEAFTRTLEDLLGEDFTADVASAWASVMERITRTMLAGAGSRP